MVELQAQAMVFCYSLTGVRSWPILIWRPQYAVQGGGACWFYGALWITSKLRLRSLTGVLRSR
jgi:hypothetical protein